MVNANLFLNLFRSKPGTEYKAGQTIMEAGTTGQSMFVVLEGEVEVKVGDKRIDVVGPGSIFGEMALIDDTPRSATIAAITDCRLVEVDRKRFEFMVSETPYFALAVMRVMADRLRRATVKSAGTAEPVSTVA